jgi:Protein of unknown function (DUF5818)
MYRWSISLMGTLALLGCLAAAQDSSSHMFSSDLIAWSGMQQPTAPEQRPQRQQPTPDPNPQSQPAPAPATPAQQASGSRETSTSPAQTFTGTISKEADSFTLKVSDTTSYKLDNQQQVQQYSGQRVRVTGTLDPASNLIHVDRVEPMS